MPSQEIPCADCDKKKHEIELGGNYTVTSCNPIPGKRGWCLINYQLNDGPSETISGSLAGDTQTNEKP